MPDQYDVIQEIAKYNLDNKTNFYTIDQVRQHQKDLQELANLQIDYDAHAEDWKVNPDAYSNLDAFKYSGSRPETLEDLYRLKGWKQDAKTTTLTGLGALASLPLAGEFATYGALGGAARVGGGFLGSHLGSKGLEWVGNYADKKLNTNFLGTTGNVLGGFLGFGLGMGATTPALRRAAVEGINLGEATNTLRGEAFRRRFNNISYSPAPLSIPIFTKTSASKPLDFSKVETESVLKPWRSDPSKTNQTTRVYLKGQKDRGYFELVTDNEPGNYSVHFKPTDKNNPNAFTQAEKDLLFQSIADLVPEGGNLSTWGSVSRGGVAGLNRFGNLGFTQTGTRLVTSKPDATRLFVTAPSNPSYVRIPKTPFYREVVPGSRPISEAELRGVPKDIRGTIDPITYVQSQGFGLPRTHLQGEDAVKMFKDYGTKLPETTRLYRVTGTSGNFIPSIDGTSEFAGMWFTDNPQKVLQYGSQTAKLARKTGIENPIELQTVNIPTSKLERYKAANILKGRTDVEFEPLEDFLIPTDMVRTHTPMQFSGNLLIDNKIQLPEIPIQDTPLIESLRKYVPEVRERYGLVGNNNITDEEILGSLYKKAFELGGDTAAVNEFGEPLVLFRGDTKRYSTLRTHENAKGSEDNILGTLFLSDPNETNRYLVRANNLDALVATGAGGGNAARPIINGKMLTDSGTEGLQGALIPSLPTGSRVLQTYNSPLGSYSIWKLPAQNSSTGVNEINSFIVRTPKMRDISYQVAVAGGGRAARPGEEFQWLIPKEDRIGKGLHEVQLAQNKAVLNTAKQNSEGLLFSRPNTPYRGEHEDVFYYALPDFNILGAKHLLPYDFRITPQWYSRLIYRKQGGRLPKWLKR